MSGPLELTESKSQFAKRIGVTPAWITKLCGGGLPLTSDGRVRVEHALKWVRANVRSKSGRPAGNIDGGADDELTAAKVRLVQAQAERSEIAIMEKKNTLIPLADASVAIRGYARGMRDHLLNAPSRHGASIAHELGVDPATTIAALERMVRTALNEAADQPKPSWAETLVLAERPSGWEEPR